MYRVFRWPYLDEQFPVLSRIEQQRIRRHEQHFKMYPTGKPLGYAFFREKKLNGKRLLFVVYEEERAVLLVLVTEKKVQQQHIDFVRQNFERFRIYVRERLGQP